MNNSLIDAFKSMPPSPCDAYSCSFRKKCATEKLACEAFVHYVSTGRTVHPMMQFRGTADKRRAANVLDKTQSPSHVLYYRLFPTPGR